MNSRLTMFLLLVGSLTLGLPSEAAISKVKDIGFAAAAPNNPSITIQVDIPAGGVATGNFLVVSINWGGDTMATLGITDTKGNTYNKDVTSAVFSSNRFLTIASARITTPLVAVTDHISIVVTSPVNNGVSGAAAVSEFSGVAVSPLDKTHSAVGSSQSPNSGTTATTTSPSELLIGAVGTSGADGGFTAGSGYMLLTPFGSCCGYPYPEFRTVAATGAYAANGMLAASDTWAAAIATYQDACGTDAQNPTVTPPPNTTVTQTICN